MKTQKLISLTLTNVVNSDSEVNLLATPSGVNNNFFDTYYRLFFAFNTPNFLFQYILNGVTTNYYLYGLINIDDMILQLNNEFLGYAIFDYEFSGFAPDYTLIIRVTNPVFAPYSLQTLA